MNMQSVQINPDHASTSESCRRNRNDQHKGCRISCCPPNRNLGLDLKGTFTSIPDFGYGLDLNLEGCSRSYCILRSLKNTSLSKFNLSPGRLKFSVSYFHIIPGISKILNINVRWIRLYWL